MVMGDPHAGLERLVMPVGLDGDAAQLVVYKAQDGASNDLVVDLVQGARTCEVARVGVETRELDGRSEIHVDSSLCGDGYDGPALRSAMVPSREMVTVDATMVDTRGQRNDFGTTGHARLDMRLRGLIGTNETEEPDVLGFVKMLKGVLVACDASAYGWLEEDGPKLDVIHAGRGQYLVIDDEVTEVSSTELTHVGMRVMDAIAKRQASIELEEDRRWRQRDDMWPANDEPQRRSTRR